MREIELYDSRFDWLVASLLAIPLVWLFYGFDAAFVAVLLFTLVGALKPLRSWLHNRMAAGVFAAGTVLFLSPLLRFIFPDGYCFDGAWSPAAGLRGEYSHCEMDLFQFVDLDLWKGPLRDLVMPIAGLGLMLLVKPASSAPENVDSKEASPNLDKHRYFRWSGLMMALLVWAGFTAYNYHTDQIAAEELRQREAEELRRKAAEAAIEAQRIAAERAAKQVDRKWLLGGWVDIENLDPEFRGRPEFYCATDTGIIFEANGKYTWSGEEGTYSLKGNEVYLNQRVRYPIGDPDEQVERLEPTTISVERNGKFLIIDQSKHARC